MVKSKNDLDLGIFLESSDEIMNDSLLVGVYSGMTKDKLDDIVDAIQTYCEVCISMTLTDLPCLERLQRLQRFSDFNI